MVNEENSKMSHNGDNSRRLLVIRHGERCDFTFNQQGINWMKRAFDVSGKYRPFDLNLPRNIPRRKDGYEKFASDSPLTEMGYLQSKLTGRALRDHNVKIDYIYCSSALRCVQTAVGIVKGMDGRSLQLNIEPGLFEWTQWCRNGIPSWMRPDELENIGYPINTSYTPFVRVEDLKLKESLDEYYDRSYALIRKILKRHSQGTVLIVAHAASLDTITRQLCGGLPRNQDDFFYCIQQTPYLACSQAVEQPNKLWRIASSPIPPLTHASNTSYNSKILAMNYPQMGCDKCEN
uniref:Protein UBASH3A homolog n=2 Tax=Ascaris TaxID=6251 RepID=F1L2L0_ASCSU